MRRPAIPLVSVLILAGLTHAAAAEVHQVSLFDSFFQPAEITINAGDTVTWTKPGGFPHNVRADNDSFRCAVDRNPGDPPAANWSPIRR